MIDVEGPLVINSGADIDVYVAGTTNPFTQDGTVDLFELTDGGTVTGLSNLAVGNSPGGTVDYTFGTSGNFVTMTVTGGSTQSSWNIAGSGSWMTAGNWNPSGVPSSVGTEVTFGPVITANATVTLDGNKTVGSINFQSPFSYTIAAGSGGTLTLQNAGSSSAIVTDSQGNHFINVPLLLNSNTAMTVASAEHSRRRRCNHRQRRPWAQQRRLGQRSFFPETTPMAAPPPSVVEPCRSEPADPADRLAPTPRLPRGAP